MIFSLTQLCLSLDDSFCISVICWFVFVVLGTTNFLLFLLGELESLGDAGENISHILSRKNIHKKSFDATTIKHLENMADAVDNAYVAMIENIELITNSCSHC